jgi:uncharacterized protein YecE (DUF72 family)
MMHYYLGCPEWSRSEWKGSLFPTDARPAQFLSHYAQTFSCVEGNTTFYALPRAEIVQRWREETPPHFRFCFKFHKSISHDKRLQNAEDATQHFLRTLAPLEDRLGPLFLQLPADFGRNRLPLLQAFLEQLPQEFRYAVEVRNLAYFDERDTERAFDELLQRLNIGRVLFDTRELMACHDNDASTHDAQRKKPKVPVRFTATSDAPFVRFVGHPENAKNHLVLRDWAERVVEWIREGRRPYVFLHTPADNILAPQLAQDFHGFVRERLPEVPELPGAVLSAAEQLSLF